MKQSLKKLMETLPSGIDGAIISSDANRRYFTDMKSSAGTLLVTRSAVCFIIDFRYIEKAHTIIKDFPVLLQDKLYEQIKTFFKDQNVQKIGIEADELTIKDYNNYVEKFPEFTFVNDNKLCNLISEMRSVKSDEEIQKIIAAQTITDKAFARMCAFIRTGMTERDVAVELEYQMHKLGATSLAFESIVVSGVNSSLPHGVPSNKVIEKGDFLTMDFGAQYDGYCSDMTRTVAMGKISEEQKTVYQTVLEAQRMAMEAAQIGKKYSEVDKVARDHIYKKGYEGCFGHGLGHSLGLYIHENPGFTTKCNDIIKENVVITVEPGIYLESQFGVRIENMILTRRDGPINLTKSDNNLITL